MIPSPNQQVLSAILRAPVTIFVGHFGSGKTEIAVNLALQLRARGDSVTLVDLDVVKPYFRSRMVVEEFEALRIRLVAPREEHFHADLPIVIPEVRAAIGHAAGGERQTIIDVGGAEVGARVLGSIPGLDDPGVADVLFVVNGNRPFAETPEAIVRMMREIEASSKIRVCGLVANTHLMHETTVDTVRQGLRLAGEVGRMTGLPIRFCAVGADLEPDVRADLDGGPDTVPVLSIDRHIMPPLELRRPGSRRRSSIF
jgi:hypothetical protein